MNGIHWTVSGCLLLLLNASCSLLTEWPPVNVAVAGKASKSGGAAGTDALAGESGAGGKSSSGSSVGGSGGSAGGVEDATFGGAANGSANGGAAGGSSTSNGGAPWSSSGAAAYAGAPAVGGASMAGGSAVGGATVAGGSSVAGAAASIGTLSIAAPTLSTGKTGIPYSATITASGASSYAWSIASGTLPTGVSLQNTSSATLTIAGIPTDAGLYPLTLNVSGGSATKSVSVSLAVTHGVAFLADRVTAGVKEVFLSEVGTEVPATPVRLNAPLATGGVSEFTWSRDGSRIAYKTSTNAGLYVATIAKPGTATLVAEDVTGYAWLVGGQVLAYHTKAGKLYVVDVSGTSFVSQEVPLPAIPEGQYRFFRDIKASPRAGEFAIDYFNSTLDNTSTFWVDALVVRSPNTTVAAYTIDGASLASGVPAFGGFSFDGRLLASGSGKYAYDISNPSSPLPHLIDSVCGAWHPTRRACLAQLFPLPQVSLHEFVPTHQSAILVNPDCLVRSEGWSPDGHHMLFRCSSDVRGVREVSLTSANTDFSLLPAGFLVNSFTQPRSVDWSPDSQWIALTANKDAEDLRDLFLIRWSSVGTLTKPYAKATAPGVSDYIFAPNSSAIAFRGVLGGTATNQLYLSQLPLGGAPSTAVAVTPTTGSEVLMDFDWIPGSRILVYRANDTGGPQLHAVHLGAGTVSAPVSISGTNATSSSGVAQFKIAPLL